jgi:hypothetical protein
MDSMRDRLPDACSLIGPFETIMPLRIGTQRNPTFRDAVRSFARSHSAACDSQTRLGNYINNEVGQAATRFQTLFRLKPIGVETLELPMLRVMVNPAPMTEIRVELVPDIMEQWDTKGIIQGIGKMCYLIETSIT